MERHILILEKEDLSATIRLAISDNRGATHYTMIAILSGYMPYCSEYSVPEFEIQEKLYNYAIPAELGYHTPHDIQTDNIHNCDLLGSKYCLYSGSPLQADPVHHALFKEGISAAWSKIEELHNNYFSPGSSTNRLQSRY